MTFKKESEVKINVAELISALEKIKDKTLPVQTEGCDCYGFASGVSIIEYGDEKFVLVERVEGL